jgi:hypothetical protein
MQRKLKKLAIELKSRGHIEASNSIGVLIKDLHKINNLKLAEELEEEGPFSWIKEEQDSSQEVSPEPVTDQDIDSEEIILTPAQLSAIKAFFGIKDSSADPKIAEYEDLISCVDDQYCGSYKLEEMERVAGDVMVGAIDSLTESKQKMEDGFNSFSADDKSLLSEILTIDVEPYIDTAQEYLGEAKTYLNEKGSYIRTLFNFYEDNESINKIASQSNYLAPIPFPLCRYSKELEYEFRKYALNVGDANTGQSGMRSSIDAGQSFMKRLSEGDTSKAAMREAGKRPGFWGKALPFVGLAFSLPLTIKNIVEGYENGKSILWELPFDKYNISKTAALTPAGIPFLAEPISRALNENKDNVENLNEILTIMKTISSFWLDVIFAMTNAVALVLDIAATLFAFIDGPLPIADALAGGISILLTAGIIGIEFGSEHYLNKFWKKQKEKIKSLANEELNMLRPALDHSYFEELGEGDRQTAVPSSALTNIPRLLMR